MYVYIKHINQLLWLFLITIDWHFSLHYTLHVLCIFPQHLPKSSTYFLGQQTELKMLSLIVYFKGELLEINYYIFLGQANMDELDGTGNPVQEPTTTKAPLVKIQQIYDLYFLP